MLFCHNSNTHVKQKPTLVLPFSLSRCCRKVKTVAAATRQSRGGKLLLLLRSDEYSSSTFMLWYAAPPNGGPRLTFFFFLSFLLPFFCKYLTNHLLAPPWGIHHKCQDNYLVSLLRLVSCDILLFMASPTAAATELINTSFTTVSFSISSNNS